MPRLQVRKLKKGAHLPERANGGDLGYDLFSAERKIIKPGGMEKVGTGVAVAFPAGWGGVIKDRSSMAAKGIVTSAGVIDNGYRGEILILLTNLGDEEFVILPNQKIAQMIPVPVTVWEIEEVDELDETDRGEGGFGSTGKHKG